MSAIRWISICSQLLVLLMLEKLGDVLDRTPESWE